MLKNEFKLASLIKKGFTRHKDLNPQIFDENKKLRKEVRSKLLVIVNDFIDSLNVDHIDSEDILLVGSIVNYNWNPYSDVDLHITYNCLHYSLSACHSTFCEEGLYYPS